MVIKAIFNSDKTLLVVFGNYVLDAFPFCCPQRAEQQPLSTTSLTLGSIVYPVLSWRSSAPEQPASAIEDSSAAPVHPPVTVLPAPRVTTCRSWALSMVWLEGAQWGPASV